MPPSILASLRHSSRCVLSVFVLCGLVFVLCVDQKRRHHRHHRQLKHNLDPTPPGYEDTIWCPRGTCNMKVTSDLGAAGPSRFFHQCYSADLKTYVEEAWTGSKTDMEAPQEWITEPQLKECPQSPVHWSKTVRKDGIFGTFRIGGITAASSSSRGIPMDARAATKAKWCWDVKGGMKPGNKIITKRCDKVSTKQLFVFKIAKGSSDRGYQMVTLHPRRKQSLCVGVARIQSKTWLRLERCIDNDTSQLFGQHLGSNLCGQIDMPNTDLVVTTQGLEPAKGKAIMLRTERDLERFRESLKMWCPST